MLILRRTIDALTDAVDTGEDPIEALDASVGWNTLLKARPEVATIAATASLDPLTVAADRYATLRKFAPDLLEVLQFRAGKGSAKTIAAIEVLRVRSEEHTSELQSLMRISYAVFCLNNKKLTWLVAVTYHTHY